MLGREGLEVRGEVLPGKPIPTAAVAVDEPRKFSLAHGGGALEEHVLHPVGNPGDARHLVAAADPVPDPKTRHRRRVYLAQEDNQAVGEDCTRCGFHHWLLTETPLVRGTRPRGRGEAWRRGRGSHYISAQGWGPLPQ